MQVISLNDGSNAVIGNIYDAAEIIASKVSYELAEYIKRILWDQDELDGYISDLEGENSKLFQEKKKLENTIQEYSNKELSNEEYFNYLIEIGKDRMNYDGII